jgi:hypothetical protein
MIERSKGMGMYTELVLGVKLRNCTPDNVIDILKYMLDPERTELNVELPDHPLFKTQRWKYMLVSDSAYFGGHTESSIEEDDGIFTSHTLNVRCNLKNYDSEIELFLHFIEPWIRDDGFIGYTRYEEDVCPELIFHKTYIDVPTIELVGTDESYINRVLDDKWMETKKK